VRAVRSKACVLDGLYFQTFMDLTLPLDYSAIERILPHRYPFLLVDRITEFEPDKRIVGIKNVTLNERYLARSGDELPVLPPTILTEAVAQVGAIMILAKPENRQKLIYFRSIERVRYRRPVHPGDVVEIEATVRRLRSRMGQLRGIARVDGKVVVEGTMTFALTPRGESLEPGS
jgi:3-hydroxyacyl-[acyl-carrier-protein] dehydratase